jgi:hypothetical protein
MWGRLKPAAQPHGMDDERMRAAMGLGFGGGNAPLARGYSYSIKGGPPPPRPPREFLESQK